MKTRLSSKERILYTVQRQPVDHIPLVFEGVCHGRVQYITNQIPDPTQRARHYLDLGVDTGINLIPPRFTNKDVTIKEWSENVPGDPYPILTREYQTPVGNLKQVVHRDADYPESVLPLDDLNVPPNRSIMYLVEREQDLDKLEFVLRSPSRDELNSFYSWAAEIKKFCEKNQILLCGTLDGVGDPLFWMSGVMNVILAAKKDPGFLEKYIEIVSTWARGMLEILLNAGADLIIRRGWYESTDFWSPRLYKEFLFERLKKEIEIAHQAGVLVSYVMNSGAMPLIDYFPELGVDIYSNIEPEKADLAKIKENIGKKITLCGGVNNYHVVEAGSAKQVEEAVTQAIEKLASGGGFILAPSDSILDLSETAKRNVYKMIDVWKKLG